MSNIFIIIIILFTVALVHAVFIPLEFRVNIWFNSFMHAFGGFLAGWFVLAIWRKGSMSSYVSTPSLLKFLGIVAGVMLIGVLWEFLEFLYVGEKLLNIYSPLGAYKDTMKDLAMDMAGGVIFAIMIFSASIYRIFFVRTFGGLSN